MLLLMALLACEDDMEMASSPCDEEARAGALEVGDSFSGDAVTLTLLSADPAVVSVGENRWELELDPAQSEDCTAQVTPWMPDHGHGSSVGEVTFSPTSLAVEELELSMGGYWEIEVSLQCADTEDLVLIPLCVDA